MTEKRLRWGLQPPDGVTTAYGARAIRTLSGYDIVRDRQHCLDVDDDRGRMERLVNMINSNGPLIRRISQDLDGAGGQKTLFENDQFCVVGDTLGSAGYVCIGAWLK